jgi:hypothetical protein
MIFVRPEFVNVHQGKSGCSGNGVCCGDGMVVLALASGTDDSDLGFGFLDGAALVWRCEDVAGCLLARHWNTPKAITAVKLTTDNGTNQRLRLRSISRCNSVV